MEKNKIKSRKHTKVKRNELTMKVCKLARIKLDPYGTPGYFTRSQLLELIAVLEGGHNDKKR